MEAVCKGSGPMYKILNCTPERAKVFCENAGDSLQTFTYFSNRPYSVVESHLKSFVFEYRGDYCAYGHLELEEGTLWLGVCVSESHLGKGFGSRMMKLLLKEGKELSPVIKLSVNKDNKPAIHLYNSLGFVTVDDNDKSYFMEFRYV